MKEGPPDPLVAKSGLGEGIMGGGDAKADGRASEAAPADGRASEAAPADGRASEAAPADGRASEAAPADGRASEAESVEVGGAPPVAESVKVGGAPPVAESVEVGGAPPVAESVEIGEGGNSAPECQAPPVGAKAQTESTAAGDEPEDPPGDWLEPLEDDEEEDEDWQSTDLDLSVRVNGTKEPEPETESPIGENEKSDGVKLQVTGGSETLGVFKRRRRKAEDGEKWLDCPPLGAGWKRKEVFRRSGFSIGKTDTYYISPRGDRVRSKIEMMKLLPGTFDLTNFDFKSGVFLDEASVKLRRKRRKTHNGASTEDGTPSERSFSSEKTETPERSHTPHSQATTPQRPQLTPQPATAVGPSPPTPTSFCSPPRLVRASPLAAAITPTRRSGSAASLHPTSSPERDYNTVPEVLGDLKSSPAFSHPVTKRSPRTLPVSHSVGPDSASNGEEGATGYAGTAGPLVYGCSSCGSSYPGMVFRRPNQKAFCPKCTPEKKPESPRNIVFRKVGQGQWVLGRASDTKEGITSPPKKTDKISKFGRKLKLSKKPRPGHLEKADTKRFKKPHAIPQYSDTEDFPGQYDDNDDADYGHKKRSRRACWKCDACLRTTDCGRCDFCMDKPKFGGRNKKRQKCRLRQCQSHAMRHLLPFQMSKSRAKQRPSRDKYWPRRLPRTHRPKWHDDMDLTEDEDEEGYMGTLRPGLYELDQDEMDNQDVGEADQDVAMSQMNYEMNCDPINGTMSSSEELYISSYPLYIQDCFQTDRSKLKMGNMDHLPAVYDTDLPLPPPQDPEALYDQASLPGQYRNLPELLSRLGTDGDRLVLGDDVEIVEVDSGEPEEPESTPVITQIFSLATSRPAVSEAEKELLGLLESLRRTVLPAHWVGLMVEGPRLQLLQCSKLSTMADTVLQIEPGFFYQISVQGQPLLLTHPLYEAHPPRLAHIDQVVPMLQDLERYTVCQGYPSCVPQPNREPVLYVRAAACGLLVLQEDERCDKCDVTQLVV
ncbi:hypothetical protein SKAU_G00113510 [Synaphobranchus kaupii]|uniref:Methyl-CpG-binding domain protein 1 n=1 Tax=Synaphobranchus kaupii TaxID=118154 RepID=A0A9Q1G1P9_SYNKA|nr:hypothetical protein SKAU_G00113510 [Synaphobranchus kaupii]